MHKPFFKPNGMLACQFALIFCLSPQKESLFKLQKAFSVHIQHKFCTSCCQIVLHTEECLIQYSTLTLRLIIAIITNCFIKEVLSRIQSCTNREVTSAKAMGYYFSCYL